MLPVKYFKPLSLESWLLCVGIMSAIASLITIDQYNMAKIKDSYLTKQSNSSSSQHSSHLEQVFNEIPVLSQNIRSAANQPAANQSANKISTTKIAAPAGWKAVQVSEGVTAYVATQTIATQTIATQKSIDRPRSEESDELILPDSLDGTRSPYVTAIDLADVLANPIAPQRYVWQGVWQGEGYSREHDADGNLVSQQEGGNDIHLTLSYDAAITHAQEPNLIVTIESQQDKTAQLTNLSAFLLDSHGKTLARKDFSQLPPLYQVSLTHNGIAAIKSLLPLGKITFSYHVSAAELLQRFPIELQAVNQFADERAQEIASLEAQGWLVKEVPSLDNPG
ncbi:MAG: hypothetical protein KME15_24100 [Drouetiella hepatica Uher 2000/2452]|jgi:hypothetical protein|uniref:Uncharacterized protein n=1 Tax=Drouetiella hepatica Uher 2000/2452 TaxID=904376 RepID=A0A951QFI7_9CYAN|nr:hypothetical protein [Drouetiella hepatica Uher 2000/2452]